MGVISRFIDKHHTGLFVCFCFGIATVLILGIMVFINYMCERSEDRDYQKKVETIERELEWRGKYGDSIVNDVFNSMNNSQRSDNVDNEGNIKNDSVNNGNNPLFNQLDSKSSKPVVGKKGDRFELVYYEKNSINGYDFFIAEICDKTDQKSTIIAVRP